MIPAAQYMRMSSELQKYSIENQTAAIAEYADRSGFSIVKSYIDSAKSGVSLKGRTGLQTLLRDVITNQVNFRAILVLDVTRWGRFQDDDEAGCYEFLCRSSGIAIIYCTEGFVNDCSTVSSILKTLSRINAGEFSRELSVRTSISKSIAASQGYWIASCVPYGYSKMIVSLDPRRNRILNIGENKGLKSDRIVLVVGPPNEVKTIRSMFRLVKDRQLSCASIAKWLDARGLTNRGSPWNRDTIRRMLHNPVYIGRNVWGRTGGKLGQKREPIPTERWACKESAFPPLITKGTFFKVQEIISDKHKSFRWTNESILTALRKLLRKQKTLNHGLLIATEKMPDPSTVVSHFGSMLRAYKLAGYHPSKIEEARSQRYQATQYIKRRVCAEVMQLFPADFFPVRKSVDRLLSRDGTKILIAAPNVYHTKRGERRWFFDNRCRKHYDEMLLCLRGIENTGLRFYLLKEDLWQSRALHMEHPWLLRGTKLSSLSELCPQDAFPKNN